MVYRKDWNQPQQGVQGYARTMKAFGRKINMTAADGTTNNVVGAFVIPGGFQIFGWYGAPVPALGAGLTLSIGAPGAGNSALFLSAAAMSGVAWPAMAATGLFFRTFTDTEIQILVANGVAITPGIIEFYMFGATV